MALIWITGFSGAGKTTVAKLLQKKLELNAVKSILLDGDEIRAILGFTENYDWEDRKKIAFIYAKLAKQFSDQGIVVIVATISMFEEVRQWNRQNNTNYLEVYLKVSTQQRRERDPKKLYSTEQNMVENESRYEEPQNPDLVFDDEQKLLPDDIVSIIQRTFID